MWPFRKAGPAQAQGHNAEIPVAEAAVVATSQPVGNGGDVAGGTSGSHADGLRALQVDPDIVAENAVFGLGGSGAAGSVDVAQEEGVRDDVPTAEPLRQITTGVRLNVKSRSGARITRTKLLLVFWRKWAVFRLFKASLTSSTPRHSLTPMWTPTSATIATPTAPDLPSELPKSYEETPQVSHGHRTA